MWEQIKERRPVETPARSQRKAAPPARPKRSSAKSAASARRPLNTVEFVSAPPQAHRTSSRAQAAVSRSTQRTLDATFHNILLPNTTGSSGVPQDVEVIDDSEEEKTDNSGGVQQGVLEGIQSNYFGGEEDSISEWSSEEEPPPSTQTVVDKDGWAYPAELLEEMEQARQKEADHSSGEGLSVIGVPNRAVKAPPRAGLAFFKKSAPGAPPPPLDRYQADMETVFDAMSADELQGFVESGEERGALRYASR
ncbi:hypothetical protein AGDE_12854 [Angomonas deanei]|uniref:Uncharacterized protein n=1 Tax=Angomonas deanei TaxID=59799 RepID=A0A7G2CGA7_9TRYP|nr:hypothetical protein AGDE_12854 [Angomonas deanei]CAD2218918.1 hypothetical protein, conserved [Angomonas deanei]|eukprot:EPY23470.1 hypothetical protein AGDE_12854 [Angomonas deanei]